jgi:hypothetical protein
LECGIGKIYSNTDDLKDQILKPKFKFENWADSQVMGQPGSINECVDRGSESSPKNLIRKLNIEYPRNS